MPKKGATCPKTGTWVEYDVPSTRVKWTSVPVWCAVCEENHSYMPGSGTVS
jgi:hypothetical protein